MPARSLSAATSSSAETVADETGEAAALTEAASVLAPAPTFGAPEDFAATRQEVLEVEPGDTLMALLIDSGVERAEAAAAIEALDDVFSPEALMPGQEITLDLDFSLLPNDARVSDLTGLSLQPSLERDVLLTRGNDGAFVAKAIDRPLELERALARAHIDSSLFEAGDAAGVPLDVMSEVIKAFSYDVDFQRDIQPGDSFEILYERFEDESRQLVRTGNVLYASITLSGDTKQIYRHESADGNADFYTAKGESVRKELLRTPLEVVRVTSKFGLRKHPVLGYTKMHKGVDFAAATGTPIFAAGNGTIVKAGRHKGYGNYIQIKHNSQYVTAYAHLSKIAKGVKNGAKVKQGEVIGYVGSTGLATGPHLHYEILSNGEQINPMKVKLQGRKLAGKDLRRYELAMAEIDRLRDDLSSPVLVAERIGKCDAAADRPAC